MSTTQELIEQLRKGTAGLTLYEIEALWGEAATALSATEKERNLTGARFFIDHGQIHDRVTGKHVTTDEDSVFCDGINSALELLNGLDASVRAAAALIVALVNSAPTDTAKLADDIEALAKEEEEARNSYLTAMNSRTKVAYMCAWTSSNAAYRKNTPAIIAALRELEAVKAREAKLREALESFAADAALWDGPDSLPLVEAAPGYSDALTVGDLRRARAALGGAG